MLDQLPHNAEAECSLIGLTLVRKRIPPSAIALSTTDFYDPTNREVWSAFLELEADGHEIDPISAYDILKRNHPAIVDTLSLSTLLDTANGIPNCHDKVFVDKVRDASVRRFVIRKLYEYIRAVSRGEKGAIQSLRSDLINLESAENGQGHFRAIADIIDQDVKPALLDLRDGISNKISTGWPAVDRVIGGGLSKSEILLLAALPGSGKSAFVLQMATNIAKQGIPVAFLSGEMSDSENGLRLISQASQSYNLNSVTHLNQEDLEFYMQWADALKALPLYFDSRTYDFQTLSRSLRTLVEAKGIKVLVIDYIQIMKLDRVDKRQRTERITEASMEVKRLAREYDLAIIEVAQFNREGAKSIKPQMCDLDGSSQLEKDTSLIFILSHEEETSNVIVRVVKGRNTGKAEIAGTFEGWKLHFEFGL